MTFDFEGNQIVCTAQGVKLEIRFCIGIGRVQEFAAHDFCCKKGLDIRRNHQIDPAYVKGVFQGDSDGHFFSDQQMTASDRNDANIHI